MWDSVRIHVSDQHGLYRESWPLKTSCKHWVFLVGLDCCKLNYKLLLLHHGPVCGKPRCRFQNCIGDLFGRLGLSCQWDRFRSIGSIQLFRFILKITYRRVSPTCSQRSPWEQTKQTKPCIAWHNLEKFYPDAWWIGKNRNRTLPQLIQLLVSPGCYSLCGEPFVRAGSTFYLPFQITPIFATRWRWDRVVGWQ